MHTHQLRRRVNIQCMTTISSVQAQMRSFHSHKIPPLPLLKPLVSPPVISDIFTV